MGDRPLLSVVITSYTLERLESILELLNSLRYQSYPHIETIHVIERSRELYDKINVYIQEKSITNVKVIFNNGEQGASVARNLGVKEAKGDVIAFIDDDVLPSSNWAEEMVKTYDDSTIGVTGQASPLWGCTPPKWLPKEFYWIVGCTTWLDSQGAREVRNVWTMNASFKREVFDKGIFFTSTIGPYNGSMTGREKNKLSEDLEFSMRAREKTGKKIIYNPQVHVRHRIPKDRLSWRYITKWSYWIGSSRRTLKKLYPKDESQSSVLGTEYSLLSHIFTRLFPVILKGFFSDPVVAWRKFALTVTVLSCVTFGYLRSSFHQPF